MPGHKFEYGPIARGTYHGLLWFTIVIGYHYPNALAYYIPFLVFLGLGLRMMLEKTGLHEAYQKVEKGIDDRLHKKANEKKRREVDLKIRDARYRGKRTKDPKLPKNW